jgi:hypothetical protein
MHECFRLMSNVSGVIHRSKLLNTPIEKYDLLQNDAATTEANVALLSITTLFHTWSALLHFPTSCIVFLVCTVPFKLYVVVVHLGCVCCCCHGTVPSAACRASSAAHIRIT